jgi:hypothetical protein
LFRKLALGTNLWITGAFGKTFRMTGGCRKAGKKILLVGFSQLVNDFLEASRNLFWMFFTKRQPKIVKAISALVKSIALIFKTLKKYSPFRQGQG